MRVSATCHVPHTLEEVLLTISAVPRAYETYCSSTSSHHKQCATALHADVHMTSCTADKHEQHANMREMKQASLFREQNMQANVPDGLGIQKETSGATTRRQLFLHDKRKLCPRTPVNDFAAGTLKFEWHVSVGPNLV